MRLLTRGLGLAFAGCWVLSGVSVAQETEIDVGGMVGLSLPTNEAANLYVPGWNAGGTLRVVPAIWPVGLQFDGTYASYNRDTANISDRGMSIVTGALSIVYQVELDAVADRALFPGRRDDQQPQRWRIRGPSRTMDRPPTLGIALGGGVAFKSEHARIAPLVDFRLLRHLRVRTRARVPTST